MRTIAAVRWYDDSNGYFQGTHGDTLDLRCALNLDDGRVARVAVPHKTVAAIEATRGRGFTVAEWRAAAEKFYRTNIDGVTLDMEPAYEFGYSEAYDGIFPLLP